MDDLVQFLRERLDEDEAAARAAADAERADTWTTLPESYGGVLDGTGTRSLAVGYGNVMAPETAGHIARHDPARVLAEVEAKRRVVERCTAVQGLLLDDFTAEHLADEVLALIALPYADHPEYREEWRP